RGRGSGEGRRARAREGAARRRGALSAAGVAPRRADLGRAVALPAAVVPALRRLRRLVDDPPALARAARGRRAPRARALPRLADAAPSDRDAAVLSGLGLCGQPLRARGPCHSCAEALTHVFGGYSPLTVS